MFRLSCRPVRLRLISCNVQSCLTSGQCDPMQLHTQYLRELAWSTPSICGGDWAFQARRQTASSVRRAAS